MPDEWEVQYDIKKDLKGLDKPAKGTLSRNDNQDHACDMIDIEARTLTLQFSERMKAIKTWFDALVKENVAVALFNPEAYKRESFVERSIVILVEVLTLLFVACLYVPLGEDPYVCPGQKTTGVGGGGILQCRRA